MWFWHWFSGSNPDLQLIISGVIVQIAVLVFIENIYDMRVCCPDNVIIDHNFVFVNNNWIVTPIVTLFKDIQNVFRYLTDVIIVSLALQLSIAPRQSLLALRSVDWYEAVGWLPGGGRVPVAAVSSHRDHVRLGVWHPGELGQAGRGLDVRPVSEESCVPPVGDGAPYWSPEECGHRVQHRAQVHLETRGRLLGDESTGDPAHHGSQQTSMAAVALLCHPLFGLPRIWA